MNDTLFWSKVDIRSEDECWEWKAYKSKLGYGRLNEKGTVWLAHRWAYRIAYGEFDLSLVVCHSCDNPSCVNPRHLWLGTQIANIKDMHAKGRHRTPPKKLSAAEEQELLILRRRGAKLTELAERFNVSVPTVSNICNGRKYNQARSNAA